MSNFIAFDLGGTLTKPEQTRDLLQLIPDSVKIFENIARYDELLIKEKTPDYESDDAPIRLCIILFLIEGITEVDLSHAAVERVLTAGALDLITRLYTNDWRIFCITNACEPYAIRITQRFGIYTHNTAATPLLLNSLRATLTEKEITLFQKLRESILTFSPENEDQIKQILDVFFKRDLPTTTVGKSIIQTRPVSGSRKTEALKRFAEKHQEPLSKWAVVGNGVSDAHMLAKVDNEGGLAIAFNADHHAISQATMSLASTDISDLKDVLQTWKKGGRKEVKRLVQEKEKRGGTGDRSYFHWLAERDKTDLDDIMKIHYQMQQLLQRPT